MVFKPSFYFQMYLFVKLGFREQIDISLISPHQVADMQNVCFHFSEHIFANFCLHFLIIYAILLSSINQCLSMYD